MKLLRGAKIFLAVAAFLLPPRGEARPQGQGGMAGMDMGEMHHDADKSPDAARSANEAMSAHHMDMNLHMSMTELRPENQNDDQRAAKVRDIVEHSIERYKDYKVALEQGYKIFMPNAPQAHYHFTNWRYAYEAEFVFNPAHPTSLLYKKTPNGYELEGAMFTAPKRATEDELNERVPLSVARWHRHVNFCMPRSGNTWQQVNWKQFGLGGSISTQEACEQAGGRWEPQIFNWMVHIYPFESDPAKVWAH
jgi:hypothetical protein